MRNWTLGITAALLLFIPPGVGYLTAPCDPLTERPLPLNPHRLQQQRFFKQGLTLLADLETVATEIHTIAERDAPTGMSDAFRRAGRVSDLATHLDQLNIPEAPPTYRLLGERLGQVRDTYSLATEDLLTYLGNADAVKRETALAALSLADEVRLELHDAINGLQYPLCQEVWRRE
jgi:hypothetical protein